MSDLEELRRVLAEREALAPDPAGIVAGARARGVRIRRFRAAAVAGGAAAAVVAVTLAAAALGTPGASRVPAGPVATPTGPVGPAGWPATPVWTAPAVPGSPEVPGPTAAAGPVSGREIAPVVPFSVTLPEGWREDRWQYQEGSFRATWAGPDESEDVVTIDVLDPASQPASLLRPSGDRATGEPGSDGSVAWLADERHFVRVYVQQGDTRAVVGSVARTLRFTERPMIAPFRLGHLPAGLRLAGATVAFPDRQRPDPRPWWVELTFASGDGAFRGAPDLVVWAGGALDPTSGRPDPANPDATTVAGRTAVVLRPFPGSTTVTVRDVGGLDPAFTIGDAARDRIPAEELARVVEGMTVLPDPADVSTWTPISLP